MFKENYQDSRVIESLSLFDMDVEYLDNLFCSDNRGNLKYYQNKGRIPETVDDAIKRSKLR